MSRFLAIFPAALTLCLLADSLVEAGAKNGKMRWTHKKTGPCKAFPAIIVPEAKSSDKPGVVTLKITFKANELAEFFVMGDGASDLDLIIKDSSGNLVERDIDPGASEGGGSDLCVCRWHPEREEEYTIIIFNRDPVLNFAQAGCN